MRGRRIGYAVIAAALAATIIAASLVFLIPRLSPAATRLSDADFGIERTTSAADADHDGLEDYWDVWLGAQAEAERHPRYDGAYLTSNGGRPDPATGVCTDLIWRAFRDAGYDLPAMINADIAAHPADYPRVAGAPDPLIDFRRVPNLHVFLTKYALSLPTAIDGAEFDPADWQAGDIVTLGPGGDRLTHTGILGPDRDTQGLPWMAHNGGQRELYDDDLRAWRIVGHFRFDAARVPDAVLRLWPH